MRYLAFLEPTEDGCYGVSFPDVPGCISAGDTVDDAIQQGAEALEFHATGLREDDLALPSPRSADAICADPAYRELRQIAQLVWIPLILPQDSPQRVDITLDASLVDAIDATAQHQGTTRSAFIARAARREILHTT